ncbi:MAG: protein kinase [Polyangiales bacterium]
MTAARHSLIGALFADDYRVEALVAEGGMGAVYSVVQQSTGRRRALKLLRPELASDPDTRERFVREAKVSSTIESDHVVQVIDAGFDPSSGAPFLVMEMLEGEDLARYVATRGPLDVREAREVLRQLCHALSAAHAAGVIHRDLKPENVFVAKSRRADVPFTIKLLDFGIASVLETSATSHATGAIVGSPAWMAPEQVDTGLIRASTDVWALGLIAFFTLTAKNYWKSANTPGATVQALLVEKLIDPIESASARARLLGAREALPPGFDDWFARCVCRDPGQRLHDAAQAWSAFEATMGSALGEAPTQSQPAWAMASGAHAFASVSRTVVASPTGPGAMSASAGPRRSPTRTALTAGAVVLLVAGASSAAWVVAARTSAHRHPSVATSSAAIERPRAIEPSPAPRAPVVERPALALATDTGASAPAPVRSPSPRVTRSVSRAARVDPPVNSQPVAQVAAREPQPAPNAGPGGAVTGGAAPPFGGPRPSRCAAYQVLERRANALMDHAASVEATEPATARNERIQAMAMRASVDTQVAQLRTMARGELSGDGEFVAMVREVDQCIANLRRGH